MDSHPPLCDLRIDLGDHSHDTAEAIPALAAQVQVVLTSLEQAVTSTWPNAAWNWMYGERTTERVVAALVKRLVGHVTDSESTDHYYGPLGGLIAQIAGRTLSWQVEIHAVWLDSWYVAIEPRLQRNYWIFTSNRIPGSREFDLLSAHAISAVASRVIADAGAAGSRQPCNDHWKRSEGLILP
jgi:hypothetical protein